MDEASSKNDILVILTYGINKTGWCDGQHKGYLTIRSVSFAHVTKKGGKTQPEMSGYISNLLKVIDSCRKSITKLIHIYIYIYLRYRREIL